MPEIKHTFQAGKMNKDVDERLVPNGEYRDALNIQIRTTDSDSVGTVQNIKSTKELWDGNGYYEAWMNSYNASGDKSYPKIIGSVTDEKSDKVYFFIKAPEITDTLRLFNGDNGYSDAVTGTTYAALGDQISSERNFVDCIVEYNTVENTTIPIVVDKFAIINTYDEVSPVIIGDLSPDYSYSNFKVNDATKYRIGMSVKPINSSGSCIYDYTNSGNKPLIKSINLDENMITLSIPTVGNIFVNDGTVEWPDLEQGESSTITHFVFAHHDRPLNFTTSIERINAINVIDNLLFWTDNINEPKKINIDRCRSGSFDFKTHTQLKVLSSQNSLVAISAVDPGPINYPTNFDLKESHITVIKKAPRYAPTLHMSRTDREGNNSGYFEGTTFFIPTSTDPSMQSIGIGSIRELTQPIFAQTQFFADDIITFIQAGNDPEEKDAILKAKFITYQTNATSGFGSDWGEPTTMVTDRIKIQMIVVDPIVADWMSEWDFALEQEKPLYELKLGRFAYRYKYEDGEYSSFSPWSELAFLPDEFDYQSKKGYNLGMVNTIRSLVIKDFIPYPRPLDVNSIDILYKKVNESSVYVVTTLKRGKDSEWENFTTGGIDTDGDGVLDDDDIKTGELKITSEMIHRVLPSNQLLRAWDNVPRFALTQEIIANRLLYANYTQGYDFLYPVSLIQKITSDNTPSLISPQKSIKSIRDYKFGMVFGDKYGRETPVIASGYTITNTDESNTAITGDLTVPKQLSIMKNVVELEQLWQSPTGSNSEPLDWIDYVKYYVKETTTEYYNLVMNRWYWAEDEQTNIWMSFNSADRNKVDEETYLILKNKHNSQSPVLDKAKYKILAIENDVPNYVKTNRLLLGKCPITDTGSGLNWDGYDLDLEPTMWEGPAPVYIEEQPVDIGKTTTRLSVGLTQWNIFTGAVAYDWATDTIGEIGNPLGREIKGQLKLRVRGRHSMGGVYSKWLYTPWRTVVHWRVVSAPMLGIMTGGTLVDVTNIEFTFGEPFGESIDMYTRFLELEDTTPATGPGGVGPEIDGLEYFLELREDIPEHKAEFDGKFFVKIEGDGQVLSNIVGSTTTTQSYVAGKSYPIHYVSSSAANEGEQGIYAGMATTTADGFFQSFLGLSNTNIWASDLTEISEQFGGYCTAGTVGYQNQQPEATRDFWTQFRSNASEDHGGGVVGTDDVIDVTFIDSARIVEGGMQGDGTDGSSPFTPSSFDSGEFTNPNGSIGVQTGQAGRMTLSYLLRADGSSVYGENESPLDLKNDITVIGTLFRWASDPNPDNIYRVVDIKLSETVFASNNQRNYIKSSGMGGSYNDCEECVDNPTDGGTGFVCERYTYQVEFRKIEPFTLELAGNEDVGMDLTAYDPRGNMEHWGNGFQLLEIVALESFDFLTASQVRDGAVWETEPKKSTELDIYYEASNAIPMFLKSDNIYDFAPIDSKISIRRPSGSGGNLVYTNISLPNVRLYRAWKDVGDDEIGLDNWAVIHLRGLNNVTGNWDGDVNVQGDDLIEFHHNDGTITTTKIYSPAVYTPESLLPDSLDSTFVWDGEDQQNYIISTNSGLADNNGQDFWCYMFTTASETRTFTNSEGQEVTVPRVWLGQTDSAWDSISLCNFANLQITDELGSFGNSLVSYEVIDDQQDNYVDLPSDVSQSGLAIDTTVKINSVLTDLTGGGIQIYNDSLVAPSGVNELVDTNQYWPNFNCWVEVELDEATYDLFSIDTSGSPIQWLDDEETEVNPDYNENYGLYAGVLWRLNNWGLAYPGENMYVIDVDVWQYPVKLGWHNCYSFGNGVESDRIRDDFNAPQIDNGVKVSSTLSEYGKEIKGSGMIYSGLYNSTSGVNNLNEFNMAEKITKDLNPSYGSIQALKTRDTDVVVLTEDKVLKVLASKDALYNADGNPQLTATDRVLGTAVPFVGDYGISKNPESLAWDQFRMYFTDKQRGAVLRLSRDGLTPISNVGMKTFFKNNLRKTKSLLGTFDIISGEYNLTLDYSGIQNDENGKQLVDKTISFNEAAKGWVSFKSFVPTAGESIAGKYITTNTYKIYDHYNSDTTTYNIFYGTTYESSIKVLFNDMPGSIKSFKTINYEGSQSKIDKHTDVDNATNLTTINDVLGNTLTNLDDGQYYNLNEKKGWYVNSFETDSQSGSVPEFINKEGKWFNKIQGTATNINNIDESEFTLQGIGEAEFVFTEGVVNNAGIWSISNFADNSSATIILEEEG